ncbi:regulator [Vibrio kagoshimensis]|uniref:regulator n=1 Tax=Vibrio kagoshimensis TaxID=2910244 RepID=UPI003D240B79
MHHREMTENYIFREFICRLSKDETAKLCFKTVRTITGWDEGKPIPPECKRLMRMVNGRELCTNDDWKHFKMHHERLELPNGQAVTAQQILAGIALLEIQSEAEIKTSTYLLRMARSLARIMK